MTYNPNNPMCGWCEADYDPNCGCQDEAIDDTQASESLKPCADCGHSIDVHRDVYPGQPECPCGCLGYVNPALAKLLSEPSVVEPTECMCDGGGGLLHKPSVRCTVHWPHLYAEYKAQEKLSLARWRFARGEEVCDICPAPFGKHLPDCPNGWEVDNGL